jgi:hypothetical protein
MTDYTTFSSPSHLTPGQRRKQTSIEELLITVITGYLTIYGVMPDASSLTLNNNVPNPDLSGTTVRGKNPS